VEDEAGLLDDHSSRLPCNVYRVSEEGGNMVIEIVGLAICLIVVIWCSYYGSKENARRWREYRAARDEYHNTLVTILKNLIGESKK
jgi:hypothetical protein